MPRPNIEHTEDSRRQAHVQHMYSTCTSYDNVEGRHMYNI